MGYLPYMYYVRSNMTSSDAMTSFLGFTPNTTVYRIVTEADSQTNGTASGLPYIVRLSYTILFSFLGVFIVLGNVPFIITYVLSKSRRMRTNATYFLVNLACADVIVGFNMPYTAIMIWRADLEHILALCVARYIMLIIPMVASILLLCVIAVDRFVAIAQPMHYHMLITKRRAQIAAIGMWGLAFIAGVLAPVVSLDIPKKGERFLCEFTLRFQWEYFGTVLVPSFLVITALLAIVYGLMIIAVLKYRKEKRIAIRQSTCMIQFNNTDRQVRQEIKMVHTSLLVLALFYLCWGPFFIITSIQTFGFKMTSPTWNRYRTITTMPAICNSAIDAVIYVWRLPHYRKTLVRTICQRMRSEHFSSSSNERVNAVSN